MTEASRSQPFDSLTYWRARHEQYRLDPRGVGNVTLDVATNEQIYKAMDRYIEQVVARLPKPAFPRVLDLGCGIGMLAPAFIRSGCDYTGVDISERAVEIARDTNPGGRFQVANIADLPFQEKFDIIIERTVFIHLVEDAYWASVIREVKRLLSPNGIFILMDHLPANSSEVPGKGPHVKFRLFEEYARALADNHLKFDAGLRQYLANHLQLTPHTYFIVHA